MPKLRRGTHRGRYELLTADEGGFDPTGGKWVTICNKHHTVCNFMKKSEAQAHLPLGDWCEDCMEEAEIERGEGPRNKLGY